MKPPEIWVSLVGRYVLHIRGRACAHTHLRSPLSRYTRDQIGSMQCGPTISKGCNCKVNRNRFHKWERCGAHLLAERTTDAKAGQLF